ncbi:MAG TPA: alpha/beta fold hydrolase [Candidatus Dormibacteraeota bacterium]|nr:alpha/beta fold hydrolase [Candidatus Dormibacteraeota bacterium]
MLITLLIVIVGVLLLQALAQSLCTRMDSRRFPAPGRIVKTSRGNMHVCQMGSGNPAIVLEAGIAASSLNWSILQPQLARFASTYSYDRPGFGWSTPSRGECTLQRMTDDLHQLVTALGVPRPYILVGHSYAAYILRVYAQRFPEEIAGMILVDPLTPEEWIKPRSFQRWQLRRGVWFSRAGAALGSIGVVRFCLWLLQRGNSTVPQRVLGLFGAKASETGRRILGELAKLPPQTVRLIRERWSHGEFFLTMARYIQALPATAAEASAFQVPSHIPVRVISGAHQPRVRLAEHQAIAAHSLQGKHRMAEKSAHWIHLDQPELIVEAFREMAGEIKTDRVPASQ